MSSQLPLGRGEIENASREILKACSYVYIVSSSGTSTSPVITVTFRGEFGENLKARVM